MCKVFFIRRSTARSKTTTKAHVNCVCAAYLYHFVQFTSSFVQATSFVKQLYYNHGLRTLQIYPIRLECSSLNSHLFKKNIVESPQCSCRAAETVIYCLLNCPNYAILRNQVLNNYLHMPIKTLLNGDPQLSGEENGQIFNGVQTFIARSGRFTQGR